MRMIYDKLHATLQSQGKDIQYLIDNSNLPSIIILKIQIGENVDIQYMNQISSLHECSATDLYECVEDAPVNYINAKHTRAQ